jgi:hypothetical protein
MWLRDSTAQVWPYLQLLPDAEVEQLIAGLIRRQAFCIAIDPYANAFNREPIGSPWAHDLTSMQPWLHERKWELDSLCYHLRLAYGYWQRSHDRTVFDQQWLRVVKIILSTFKHEQRFAATPNYTFQRITNVATDTLADNGLGNPVNPIGLIASSFRPSDDATILPFLIPANYFAQVSLRQLAHMLIALYADSELAHECNLLAQQITDGLANYAIVNHPQFGQILAYEVDGFGGQICMDDANIPSLLALPYLGALKANDPLYQNTRRFILSTANPWYFVGTELAGIGSIHTGRERVWPLAILMAGLTANSVDEIKHCLLQLKRCHFGRYFMHESIACNDVSDYTRPWFAWANTLCGEFLWKVWRQYRF